MFLPCWCNYSSTKKKFLLFTPGIHVCRWKNLSSKHQVPNIVMLGIIVWNAEKCNEMMQIVFYDGLYYLNISSVLKGKVCFCA